MPDIPLIPGTLDQDCYPASAQAFYDAMFARGHGIAPDISGLLIQDAAPDPIYRGNKGWIPTSGGVPIYPGAGVFIWHPVVGHWVARPYKPAADPRPEVYIGDLAALPTFDGGDVGAPGQASGPMWELWTAIDGRVPVGAGTIPGSGGATLANLATTDSNGLSGEYKHVLTGAEGAVADHIHPLGLFNASGSGNADDAFFNWVTPAVATFAWTGKYITGGDGIVTAAQNTADIYTLKANNGNGVVSDGHNTMQPFIGVYWIKRTALREFYRAG